MTRTELAYYALIVWAFYELGRALGYRMALRHVAAANALKRAKQDVGGNDAT